MFNQEAFDRLRNIENLIYVLQNRIDTIMAALDDFITDITARMDKLDTVEASLKTFVQGLFDQIKAGVPAVTPRR